MYMSRSAPHRAVEGMWEGYGTRVGIPGWVYWVGIPGEYPAAKDVHAKVPDPSGAGPGTPARGGVGGDLGPPPYVRTHPSGARAVGLQPPSLVLLEQCRLLANRAKIDHISRKLSQNGEVSPKNVKKASHSPYSQNGL